MNNQKKSTPVKISKRFLNEEQIRVGKNLEALVDRFAMTNNKARAGDIGEEIAVRYLKEKCGYKISRNANEDFKNDLPFADVWGIDKEGHLSLVSVKASSTLFENNNNALANSNVKLKSVYSMIKYFNENYDHFYNKVVSKFDMSPIGKLNEEKDEDIDVEDPEQILGQSYTIDSSPESVTSPGEEWNPGDPVVYLPSLTIPVKLGILSIDLGVEERVYKQINKTIEDIASKSKIEQMGPLEKIAKTHSKTFKVDDGNLYSSKDNEKIEYVIDFMNSMSSSTVANSPIFRGWREQRVNKIIEDKYGKDNNAYVMLRFFEKNVDFYITYDDVLNVSNTGRVELSDSVDAGAVISSGMGAIANGFDVSDKPGFNLGSKDNFTYIGSEITLKDAALFVDFEDYTALTAHGDSSRTMIPSYDGLEKNVSNRTKRIRLHKELNDLLYYYLNNKDFKEVIAAAKEIVNKNHGITVETVIAKSLSKLIIEKKKRRRSKCIPARRRIASGGKAGSYADPRTGGKQAYAALKKAKPPGSKGGWTKKKCICCHKCRNDRSAPNGFVCTNPSHLYWGTKADNTYDQNRGNGWAARNKNKNEGDPKGEEAFSHEIMVSEDKIRDAIKKILLEDAQSESWFGNSFVAFKKEVSKGKDPLKVAKKNLNEIGRGSTRVVFDLPDNDDFVLKIINTEAPLTNQAFIGPDGNVMPNVSPEGDFRTRHGFFRSHMRQSNEWEADLIMQQKFPDVFPKTFEKADDFSWILSEKALPIATLGELIDILGVTNTFSSFARNKKVQFIAMIKEAIEYFKNPDHRLRVVNESYDSTITGFNFDDKTNKETFSTDLFDVLPTQNNNEAPSDTIRIADDEPYTPVEDPHDKRVKELISNAHNRKILGAMADLGIPPREFLPKNLGISSLTGKLLIIDASLWEEKKKVR